METNEQSIVREVIADFNRRVAKRSHYDAVWKLNEEFFNGNQYRYIGADNSVFESSRDFYWQQRAVYNHIAPIIEARLARLSKIVPSMSIKPFSQNEEDINAAKLSTKILTAITSKLGVNDKIAEGTMWSEIAGSVFYKVVWDSQGGDEIATLNGKSIKSGEVKMEVCSPYEIYPSDFQRPEIEYQQSIMHAKRLPVSEIFERWGEVVEPTEDDTALVIEKYTASNDANPNGELIIVAGDKLVYKGEIPYALGEDGERIFPFIKQDCLKTAGEFFGTSIVERLIPVQRAYNSVKNRKHEFLNRLAMGVLAVEDGSVDIDNLEEEGLSPGKILVYRMGSTPPKFMDGGSVPEEFGDEEEKLLSEFVTISGVSDILSSGNISSRITSATALQLLIEQEDERINLSAQSIRSALLKISKYILRLYKQFAKGTRFTKLAGNKKTEIIKWKNSDLGSDDVVFEVSEQISSSAKRNLLLQTFSAGLFNDKDGKVSSQAKSKLLEILGFGGWEFLQNNNLNANKQNSNIDKTNISTDKQNVTEKQDTKIKENSKLTELATKNETIKQKKA